MFYLIQYLHYLHEPNIKTHRKEHNRFKHLKRRQRVSFSPTWMGKNKLWCFGCQKKGSCAKGLLIINELLFKKRNKTTYLVFLGGFYVHKKKLFKGHYARELKKFPILLLSKILIFTYYFNINLPPPSSSPHIWWRNKRNVWCNTCSSFEKQLFFVKQFVEFGEELINKVGAVYFPNIGI
jgi:hypothetical protein